MFSHVRINMVYLQGRGVFYCLIWLKPSIIHPLDYHMSDGGSHNFKRLDNISLASNTVSSPGRRETHREEPDRWIWWLLTAPLGCHWPGRALHLQTGSNSAEKHKHNEQSFLHLSLKGALKQVGFVSLFPGFYLQVVEILQLWVWKCPCCHINQDSFLPSERFNVRKVENM